jgi:hypothetical protein
VGGRAVGGRAVGGRPVEGRPGRADGVRELGVLLLLALGVLLLLALDDLLLLGLDDLLLLAPRTLPPRRAYARCEAVTSPTTRMLTIARRAISVVVVLEVILRSPLAESTGIRSCRRPLAGGR